MPGNHRPVGLNERHTEAEGYALKLPNYLLGVTEALRGASIGRQKEALGWQRRRAL